MSAQTNVSRPAQTTDRLRSVAIAMLGAAGLVAGLGIAVAAQQLTAPTSIEAPVFDAVQFRAGEKFSLTAPVFDAVQFRAGEKDLGLPAGPAYRAGLPG